MPQQPRIGDQRWGEPVYNRVRRAMSLILIGLGLVLTGCIQPISEVDQTKTMQATLGFSPVSVQSPTFVAATAIPDSSEPTATAAPQPQLPAQVAQFISNRGAAATNLQIWYDAQRGADRFVGFSYAGSAGPCAGFLVLASVNAAWQLTESGALYCAPTPTTDGFAANTFVLTSDGQPNTIVFGRVEQAAVTVIQIVFDDGSTEVVTVSSGGFLIVKPGVTSPTSVIGADAQGNIVLPNIPNSPV